MEEKSQPLDFNSSPSHCTTTTITTGSTNTRCSSNNSSWCESDFTSDYLPSWGGGNSQDNVVNEVEVGKKYLPRVGEDCLKTTTETETYADVGPKVSNYLVHRICKIYCMCLLVRVPWLILKVLYFIFIYLLDCHCVFLGQIRFD